MAMDGNETLTTTLQTTVQFTFAVILQVHRFKKKTVDIRWMKPRVLFSSRKLRLPHLPFVGASLSRRGAEIFIHSIGGKHWTILKSCRTPAFEAMFKLVQSSTRRDEQGTCDAALHGRRRPLARPSPRICYSQRRRHCDYGDCSAPPGEIRISSTGECD